MKYVLITPAHNEQAFIEHTLRSMFAQTLPPARWVIVDDGSTDKTVEIAERYARQCSWINFVRLARQQGRSFSKKVGAFNAGFELVRTIGFDVVGNLDADISFEPDYLEFLLSKFAADSALGVAGTPFTEDGYDSASHSFEGENHVAGGCQLFRRKCFEDIGGYTANAAGGVDWIAVTTARMMGWKTQSFREKRFHHHRPMGTAGRGTLGAVFLYGRKGFLPWKFTDLGRVPDNVLGDKATVRPRRMCINGGLYGGVAYRNQKGSFARTDAISSRRGNEEATPYSGHSFEIQEGRPIPLGSACPARVATNPA